MQNWWRDLVWTDAGHRSRQARAPAEWLRDETQREAGAQCLVRRYARSNAGGVLIQQSRTVDRAIVVVLQCDRLGSNAQLVYIDCVAHRDARDQQVLWHRDHDVLQ